MAYINWDIATSQSGAIVCGNINELLSTLSIEPYIGVLLQLIPSFS